MPPIRNSSCLNRLTVILLSDVLVCGTLTLWYRTERRRPNRNHRRSLGTNLDYGVISKTVPAGRDPAPGLPDSPKLAVV